LFGLVVFSVAYIQTGAQERMDRIGSDIKQWESKSNLETSNGLRLEMYRSGWAAFLDSPWIGYGYRNSNYVASRYISDLKSRKRIAGFSHLHNVYLTHMVNAGILGLFSLLALFFIPLTIFIKRLADKRVFQSAAMGTMLIVGYMSIGMVHSVLQEEYKNSFFLFMLAFYLQKTTRRQG